jgi:hypothetical protein
MGVIFQNGFGVGTVPNNNVTGNIWDPQYTSNGLSTYPYVFTDLNYPSYSGVTVYNSTICDAYAPGIYAALAKTAITAGQKRMITFGLDFDDETSNPNYTLGFGTTGTNLENFLGVDTNSIGITNEGNVLYNNDLINIPIFSGLPTFGNVGDIIDIAINGNTYMWYRVNGGDWNGDNTADPATNSGGLLMDSFSGSTLHPAIALGGFSGPSVFSVYQTSVYGLPSGFSQISGDRPSSTTFTITSNMFDQTGGYGPACNTPQGEFINFTGLTINQTSDLGCGAYAQLLNYSGVESAFSAAGATTDYNGYICDVVWGPNSTITNGIAKVAYDTRYGRHQIEIVTIDPTDTRYLNNDSNPDGTSLAGTFNFPATFTIRMPLDNKGGWC